MDALAYLGPEGTFTHQAALALAPERVRLTPLGDLACVLNALKTGAATYAVAAETSAAGPIAETVAALETGWAQALARYGVAVSFDLYRRGDDGAALAGVYGHEKALAQIAPWIAAQRLSTQAAPSNTHGLESVRDGGEPGWGAVGPPGLDEKYGLEVAARGLEGPARHETVFVLLRRRA